MAKAPIYTILEDNIMAGEKVRFQMRIDPDTDRKVKAVVPIANCRSQNEFVEHVRFHDLRRTFATMALQNGVDPKTVSGMLGHYSTEFTLDVYTNVTKEMKRDAARKISGFIWRRSCKNQAPEGGNLLSGTLFSSPDLSGPFAVWVTAWVRGFPKGLKPPEKLRKPAGINRFRRVCGPSGEI